MAGGLSTLINWFKDQLGGSKEEKVTPDSALSYAPVWYAVNRIAGHIASMPLNLMYQDSRSREITIASSHIAHKLLRNRPNTFQIPFIFKQQLMTHALLWGNGRAYIHWDGVNSELIPLMPDRTVSGMIDGEKWHATIVERDERLSVWENMKQDREKTVVFRDTEVLHIAGLGFDGIEGKSLVQVASRSLGIGIGSEKHIQAQQKKGYAGGLILEAPEGAFSKESEAREFLKGFREAHEGAENSGKVGMLRGGVTAKVLAMSNADAQFIEQRKFQRQDAALWFLLEQILGDDSSVSYNSLEQKNLAYLQNCLGRWMAVWEQECQSKLLSTAETARGYYWKFNEKSLLRADAQTTANVFSTLITSRVMNPNEARERMDMNPYEGGDSYENPAVTPGAPGQQSASSNTQNRVSNAWLRDLLTVEANRVMDATKSKAFIKKVEEFYDRWESKLADAVEAMGGERELAAKHCQESKDLLVEALKCTDKSLADSVAACVEGWPDRAEKILQELCCVAS